MRHILGKAKIVGADRLPVRFATMYPKTASSSKTATGARIIASRPYATWEIDATDGAELSSSATSGSLIAMPRLHGCMCAQLRRLPDAAQPGAATDAPEAVRR
jgi:hypothetical protein